MRVRWDADAKVKQYEAVSDGARAQDVMKDAAVGRLPNGGAYKRKIVHRPAYQVEDCDYTTLTYSKPKAEAKKEIDE
jgi:hypothetical protein